ncbi:MAG: alpha/beta hydrolase fold domain-containing protein [Planctomycetes bacterium]|nr:alpha/beta hydrolase fold domain-containing protein [Planctomycetota bacterium]
MNRMAIVAGLVFVLSIANPGVPAAGQDVTVTTARRVHPVLIRNEAGALLQIVVDVQRDTDLRLQAMHFALDGTDDVSDLESLGLFSTGARQDFATTTPFGKPTGAAKTFALRGDLPLRPGKNVFWLSCRLKPTANLSHRVRAVCTSIETAAGKVPAKELTPAIRQRIGVALRKHQDDGVHTYRIPALTTTPKGTLLCVYDMRRRKGRDLQEDIDIGLSRSTDGGRTWEPARVIMDMGKYGGLPEEQNGCSDPGIIVDRKTGAIFCFAVWMHGNPGKHQWTGDGSAPGYEIGKAAQILMVTSNDDGRTWTKPVNLTRKLKPAAWWLFAPSPQQGIHLADGTLVMPVQGRDAKGVEFSTIMTSGDHGATWTVGTPAYRGGSECQAVQLGDGSLMLNMRNERERFRAVFVTRDLGKSWQPHATNRKTLIEPNCNGSLLRVDYVEAGAKKHLLLFSNPHTQKGRTHQTIQVSFDDGRTWPTSHHLLLDEGRGAGYPSLTRVDERHIGIVYEGSQAHLVFERIPLTELLRSPAQSAVPGLLKREVSREGIAYLQKLRKRTPFGTNDFNLKALRAGMGSRRLPTVKGVKLIKVKIGTMNGEWLLAPGADPDVRLLYLHGGGFVSGSGGYYLAQAAHVSAAAKCAVLLPDYRLAPEHRFPAGLDDCVLAHQWMVANGPAGPKPARATFVAGDSAGGNLTLATLLALRDRKMKLPAGGIAISPTTDLTLASESLKTVYDPILSAKTMPVFRDLYLGKTDPRNPLASPVFGNYRGLPPLLIQAGEHEMLRDDSIRVARKARANGIAVTLEIWPGMFHVFQSHEPLLPEAREAINHIAEFMRSSLPRK